MSISARGAQKASSKGKGFTPFDKSPIIRNRTVIGFFVIMTKRLKKQLIVASIFLLFVVGAGFLVYYSFRPAPTCSDGVQNQGEEGIDCGGPCSSCELSELNEIEVLWTKALSVQDNFYDLAAQIKNPNQNYGSGHLPYQFEIYDSANNLIGRFSGQTFILPNQTKYLVRTRIESERPIKRVGLFFDKEINWQKLEDIQPFQLSVEKKEYRLLSEQEPGFSQARALVVNRTNFDFDKIEIDVLLFDDSRNLLAVNTSEIRTLLAGQERDFVSTWFNRIEGGQVVFVGIEAETNVFDPSNFLSTGREDLEKFQEY